MLFSWAADKMVGRAMTDINEITAIQVLHTNGETAVLAEAPVAAMRIIRRNNCIYQRTWQTVSKP